MTETEGEDDIDKALDQAEAESNKLEEMGNDPLITQATAGEEAELSLSSPVEDTVGSIDEAIEAEETAVADNQNEEEVENKETVVATENLDTTIQDAENAEEVTSVSADETGESSTVEAITGEQETSSPESGLAEQTTSIQDGKIKLYPYFLIHSLYP